jgi:hypothetical protein
MAQRKRFIQRLQSIVEIISGGQPWQPLPDAYFEQPDWQMATQLLQLPAAWRRPAKVR